MLYVVCMSVLKLSFSRQTNGIITFFEGISLSNEDNVRYNPNQKALNIKKYWCGRINNLSLSQVHQRMADVSAFYSPTVSFDYCRSVLVSCIMRYRCSLHRKCYHLFLYCISCVYLLLAHLPLPGMSCLSHSNSQRPLHLQRLRKSWRRWLSLEQVASCITLRPCCMFWNVSTTVFRFVFSSLVYVNFTPVKNVRGILLSKLIYQSEHFVCVFFCQTSRTASTFFGGNLDEKILRWWLCLKYKAGTQPSSA